MATEFGTGKTIFILAIVVGCFAILWPKIFYPMLQSSVSVKPNIVPTTDCCDVIFEKDLNAIKIMTQLCERILSSHSDFDKRLLLSFQHGKLTREIVNRCNAEVHTKCDVDIREFLMEKVRLGRSYQQMLNELRSLNSSFCLKTNFGISPGLIGAPRRMRVWEAKNLRQERPPHLRPHMMHPALREKGRAIPHSHIVPRVMEKETPSAPLPMPGMRPPMGGAGHVVPAPKGSTTMGIIMPLYTIGIVIFFMYTMMRLIFKKSEESNAYKEFQPDPEFRRVVFSDTEFNRQKNHKVPHIEESNTKLVVSAISGLVAEVTRDILSKQETSGEQAEDEPEKPTHEKKVEEDIKQKVDSEVEKLGINIDVEKAQEKIEFDKVEKKTEENVEEKFEGKAVQVVGMEMTESLEGGHKWSRPSTPVTPTVTPTPPPQSIYLEGSLPSQSQLLVSQSEIEKLSQEGDESPVILAGKVTLSLIGLDDTLNLENDGPMITSVSSDESSEEEEEEIEYEENEVNVEQVSEDEAEAIDDIGINGDDDLTTNYTTASAVGLLGDETAGDFSMMEPHHDEGKEEEEEEELEEDVILSSEPSKFKESKSSEENEKIESMKPERNASDILTPSNALIEIVKPSTEYEDEEEEDEEEEEVEEEEEEVDIQESKSKGENEKGVKGDIPTQELTDRLIQSNAPTETAKPITENEGEVEEDEEEVEEDEEEVEEDVTPSPATAVQEARSTEEKEEEEEEVVEEDEIEEEDEEEEEEIGRPQSLQHQHQR